MEGVVTLNHRGKGERSWVRFFKPLLCLTIHTYKYNFIKNVTIWLMCILDSTCMQFKTSKNQQKWSNKPILLFLSSVKKREVIHLWRLSAATIIRSTSSKKHIFPSSRPPNEMAKHPAHHRRLGRERMDFCNLVWPFNELCCRSPDFARRKT